MPNLLNVQSRAVGPGGQQHEGNATPSVADTSAKLGSQLLSETENSTDSTSVFDKRSDQGSGGILSAVLAYLPIPIEIKRLFAPNKPSPESDAAYEKWASKISLKNWHSSNPGCNVQEMDDLAKDRAIAEGRIKPNGEPNSYPGINRVLFSRSAWVEVEMNQILKGPVAFASNYLSAAENFVWLTSQLILSQHLEIQDRNLLSIHMEYCVAIVEGKKILNLLPDLVSVRTEENCLKLIQLKKSLIEKNLVSPDLIRGQNDPLVKKMCDDRDILIKKLKGIPSLSNLFKSDGNLQAKNPSDWKKITLSGDVTIDVISNLKKTNPFLAHFEINDRDITSEAVVFLMDSFPNMTHLKLSDNRNLGPRTFENFKNLKQIKEVNVGGQRLFP